MTADFWDCMQLLVCFYMTDALQGVVHDCQGCLLVFIWSLFINSDILWCMQLSDCTDCMWRKDRIDMSDALPNAIRDDMAIGCIRLSATSAEQDSGCMRLRQRLLSSSL